jgi:uncharacterized protein with ParB-like and HNH nuclease domain
MQIDDVFSANPKSVWEYLCENGQGLYIPAYQRPYSWDKSKIIRLFEDACHGLSLLIKHDDSITFIGTIIAIHDTQLLTVSPLVKGETPSKIMTIIDGQQRLTTLLLINSALHEEISIRSSKLSQNEREDHMWLYEECMKITSRLSKTYEEDMAYGDENFRFYPRMIRAYDDSWSRKKDKASYSSPIGFYLHNYGTHSRTNAKKFKFNVPNGDFDKPKYKLLIDARKNVLKLIQDIAEKAEELEQPEFNEILNSQKFQETLLKAEFPESVRQSLSLSADDDFKQLLRLVLFGNFVLDRIAITIVTAKNEDYAFDMFESLNTTGEPLTAFETFKPRVVHSETLQNYEKSETHQYMKRIEGYLDGFSKTEDKQDATSRLIVSFALSDRGEKLSKRLSDQRRFFKESFESLGDEQSRRSFVQYLSHAAQFIQYSWPDDKKIKPTVLSAEDAIHDDAILCLDFLRSFKHTITQGVLIRYYSEIYKADASGRAKAVDDFSAAVKACAAFSLLWRASRRGTDGIDMQYRRIMEQGHPPTDLPPVARRMARGSMAAAPDVGLLKKAFASILKSEGKVATKHEWVKLVSNLPAYDNKNSITRFILLAAAHDSSDDPKAPGLTIAGKKGLLPIFDFSHWRDEETQTVEHIAPQTKEGGWLDEIYENPETVDRLGNLTLLPRSENASIGNSSWAKKRLMYKVLCAATPNDIDLLKEEGRQEGVVISKATSELLANSRYLPMAKALVNVDDWNLDLIERRSIRIAELAWAQVAPWLELPT